MKITCQASQSKYTIADDKIQGKVAKIRCRKCGATVLVDASTSAGANGSGAASGDAWMVSVAEGDQRTMTLQEVIDAYNSGLITGDTYLWKDGMGDWLPLSEVVEIVEALNAASGEASAPATAQEDYSAPAQGYNPPAAYSPPAAAVPVAARRETGRGRGDLFGGTAAEEEVATSAPVQVTPRGHGGASAGGAAQASTGTGLTGGRNEQSVLFSLSALTGAKAPAATASVVPASSSSVSVRTAKFHDSGVIDLGALAKAQAAKPVEAAAAPMLAAPSPFLFPSALGNVETYQIPEQQKKSSMPLIIVGGVAVVAIAVAIFALSGKKEEVPALPAGAALSAATVVTPEPSASAPTPSA